MTGREGKRSGPDRASGTALAAFAASYFLLALGSEWLTNDATQFATFWPAAGLYVGVLLASDRSRWPGFVAAALAGDTIVSVVVERKPLLAAALVAGDAVEAVLAATLIRAATRGRFRSWRLRDMLSLLLLGAVVAPSLPSLLGGVVAFATTGVPPVESWLRWWAGDGLGILVVAPLVLAWRGQDSPDAGVARERPAEFAALVVATVAVGWAVFRDASRGVLAQEHLVLPIIVWAALRFGVRGATASGALLATTGSATTAWAASQAGAQALAPDAVVVQAYLAIAVTPGLLLATEVTGLARTQGKLRLARFAVDQGADAQLVCDASGRIVLASEAAGRLLGREVGEIVGSDLAAVDPTLHGTFTPEGWAAVRARGAASHETTLADPAGRRIAVEVRTAALSLDGIDFLSWSGRDVSDRNRAVEEQRLAAVGTLASGVGHEINNPLTYVTSNLAFLEEVLARLPDDHPDAKEAREAAQEAALGARRIRDIVRDLRFVARPPDGPRIEIDPVAEIRSALNLAQGELHRRSGVTLALEPCPPILAAQGQIGQVMLHLLVNAAQAVPAGSPGTHAIRVTSGTDGDGWARIEVADTGVGMPASIRERVFEPFFSTRTALGGAGLGLALCHGIVTSLGGTIDVESEEGRGTTVRVRLPPAA